MNPAPALFTVTDRNELLALSRLVAEAKFQPNPEDAALWGSPYVHELAKRISEGILDSYRAEGKLGLADRYTLWMKSLPENVALPIVRSNLRRDASRKFWTAMSRDEKVAYVRGCIAPFVATDDFIAGLIHDAEV